MIFFYFQQFVGHHYLEGEIKVRDCYEHFLVEHGDENINLPSQTFCPNRIRRSMMIDGVQYDGNTYCCRGNGCNTASSTHVTMWTIGLVTSIAALVSVL